MKPHQFPVYSASLAAPLSKAWANYGIPWGLIRRESQVGSNFQHRVRKHFIAFGFSLAPITMAFALASSAIAEVATGGAPAVGVITAEYKPMAETTEINGRIQSRQRVDLVPRVTAFLNERLFDEGAEVKKDQLLYRLERAPFEADVEAKQAAIAEAEAQLENANVALARAQELFQKSAGTQVALDNALAAQRTAAAQLKAAQAQLHQSQINLDYTEIRAPIDGRIGRTSMTIGNVVSPTTGVLATIVSPDPMYVVFPVSVRRILELRDRYADKGGFDAVKIELRLPNGRMYDQVGKLDFVDIRVARDTDTIVLRGTIANPVRPPSSLRELADDMFVTVLLEAVEPRKVLAVPRNAVLSDQQGDYVYVVTPQNVAEQRRVKLGQSTPETAAVIEGLNAGERVIVEGVQRARPNAVVAPAPASPTPGRG
jgi:membrane fusion protein, multidrug efflux system